MVKPRPPDNGARALPDALPVATVSIADAARVMGIGTSTAYRMVAADEFPIPVRRFGNLRKVLRADLERWAAGDYPAAV